MHLFVSCSCSSSQLCLSPHRQTATVRHFPRFSRVYHLKSGVSQSQSAHGLSLEKSVAAIARLFRLLLTRSRKKAESDGKSEWSAVPAILSLRSAPIRGPPVASCKMPADTHWRPLNHPDMPGSNCTIDPACCGGLRLACR